MGVHASWRDRSLAPNDQPVIAEPLESEIQRSIFDYLRYKHYFCWRNNTGGFRSKDRVYHFGHVGSGDIFGVTREGKFFSIEVKRPGKMPTMDQAAWITRVKQSNGIAFVAYSVDDVIANGL